MPSTKPHRKEIKIAGSRLISASGKKPAPPPRMVTPKPMAKSAQRPWHRKELAAAGGAFFLLVVAILGICVGQSRRSTPSEANIAAMPSELEPIALKQYTAESRLSAAIRKVIGLQLKDAPSHDQAIEIKVAVEKPKQFAPKPIPSEPELLTIEPRLVIVPIKDPPPTIQKEPETKLVVASIEAPQVATVAPPRVKVAGGKASICEKFGTTVEFQKSPNTACDMAKKDNNKLVMILHIAGNFEDKGFT